MKTVKNITLVTLIAFGSVYSQETQCNRLLGKGLIAIMAGLSLASFIHSYSEYGNNCQTLKRLEDQLGFSESLKRALQRYRDNEPQRLQEIRRLKEDPTLTEEEQELLRDSENYLTTNGAPNYERRIKVPEIRAQEEEKRAFEQQKYEKDQQAIAEQKQQCKTKLSSLIVSGIFCCGASYLFFNK